MADVFDIGIRELDHRSGDGLEVTLFWSPATGAFVAVEDQREGASFQIPVDAADALEAFRHPYAFAAAA
ncbi:MAG TPA: hypothetical protein VGQ15_04130 [Gaiellaceae bacterium]|nr:hypothetical protein [Gaiellaceae bacterium]